MEARGGTRVRRPHGPDTRWPLVGQPQPGPPLLPAGWRGLLSRGAYTELMLQGRQKTKVKEVLYILTFRNTDALCSLPLFIYNWLLFSVFRW